MHDSLECLNRPGVYHAMFLHGPQTPAQNHWLDETCALVEAFVTQADLDFERCSIASLAVHVAADFLFLHFEHAADWSRLEPDALAARLAQEMANPIFEILSALSAFFVFLAATGRVPRARGQYVACYFEALATIDAGSRHRRASRAERRAAARNTRRQAPRQ